MRFLTIAAIGALAVTATPAFAQDEDAGFEGPYIGGSFGYTIQNNDIGEFQRFDRGFNGSFDTITTTTGANAFSPGFCNGAARGPVADALGLAGWPSRMVTGPQCLLMDNHYPLTSLLSWTATAAGRKTAAWSARSAIVRA